MGVGHGGGHTCLFVQVRRIVEKKANRCNPHGRPVAKRPLTAKQTPRRFQIGDATFRYQSENGGRPNRVSAPWFAYVIGAEGVAQMLGVEAAYLEEGLGQADGHSGVVGVNQGIGVSNLGAQPCFFRTVEGQFADGVPQSDAQHAAQKLGIQDH